MRAEVVYEALVRLLEAAQQQPPATIVARIGMPPALHTITSATEAIDIETSVQWLDRRRGLVQVVAEARGGSTWLTERVRERVILNLAMSGADESSGG